MRVLAIFDRERERNLSERRDFQLKIYFENLETTKMTEFKDTF